MIQENARVLWNKNIGASYYRIGLTCDRIYSDAKPGQFVMLRLSKSAVPLLRRPFSIHRLIIKNKHIEGIELLYTVVGKGTERLSMYRKGDVLDMLGPLGNGFLVRDHFRRILIAAGGIGVAPMLFLASSLVKKNIKPSMCKVFLGARSKQDLLCEDEFSSHGIEVLISTDDGSAGDAGPVTHPMEIAVKKNRPDIIYACGPLEMLRHVIKIAEVHAVSCQISIETVMACGIGACLGCAVEIRNDSDKYLHACRDGPVFDAGMLKI